MNAEEGSVRSSDGQIVGWAGPVVIDDATNKAQWLVIRLSQAHKDERLVPMEGAKTIGSETHLPFSAKLILDSPPWEDEVLNDQTAAELRRYFYPRETPLRQGRASATLEEPTEKANLTFTIERVYHRNRRSAIASTALSVFGLILGVATSFAGTVLASDASAAVFVDNSILPVILVISAVFLTSLTASVVYYSFKKYRLARLRSRLPSQWAQAAWLRVQSQAETASKTSGTTDRINFDKGR